MENEYQKHDKELTQEIDKVVYKDGDISKSKERQKTAERLIQRQKDFRKRHNLR